MDQIWSEMAQITNFDMNRIETIYQPPFLYRFEDQYKKNYLMNGTVW